MSTGSYGWNQLSWPIKLAIITIPLIGLGYLTIDKGLLKNKIETFPSDTSSVRSVTDESKLTRFDFHPPKPVDGELKGIVEVGATGFNSFIINMDKEKRWEIQSKDFGRSLVYEGLATTYDLKVGLKKYIADMFDKGVLSRNMHFIISSGAQKIPKTLVIVAELKKIGFVVNLVTPEQEGKFALRCALPATFREKAFVTDIGSANTKISWVKDKGLAALETEGSKYYEKELKDEDVYNMVKDKVSQIPAERREMCFIIGGVPYEMANEHRNGEERYTILKAPSAYSAAKAKMKCGLNIYKAIIDETGCDTFVFDWDANFSIGFLLGLP